MKRSSLGVPAFLKLPVSLTTGSAAAGASLPGAASRAEEKLMAFRCSSLSLSAVYSPARAARH
jgi:hypothetical protein